MVIRLVGLVLIIIGVVSAVFSIYLPMQSGELDHLSRSLTRALVFFPLAIVTGLAFLIGGTPALDAFRARPKSRGQLMFVLGIIIGSGVLTGLSYWQLQVHAPKPSELERIRDFKPQVPQITNPQFKPRP
ncbi:MAG: hypothetical protein KF785_00515 [Gemmatimonadales bacterium]|mgnify:CR=1 FL=1|nr:hypothetical protein [Gemmatimonadales bacterium]